MASAFIQERVLSVAEGAPWHLCIGDVRANIRQLAQSPQVPGDLVTRKARELALLGFPERQLVDAIERMRAISWTTIVVEQSHGSAAVIRRLHKQYGQDILMAKSMLHMLRPIFSSSDWRVPGAAQLQARLRRTASRQPEKWNGPAQFLSEAVAARKRVSSGSSASLPLDFRGMQALRGACAAEWRNLSAEQRASYQRRAERSAEEGRLQRDAQAVELRAQIAAASQQAENQRNQSLHRVSSCRIPGAARVTFHALAQAMSRPEVERLRQQAATPPPMPSPKRQAAILATAGASGVGPPAEGHPRRAWVADICRRRADLCGKALRFTDAGGSFHFYLILYARQSPFVVGLAPLQVAGRALRVEEPTFIQDFLAGAHFQHEFLWRPGVVTCDDGVAFGDECDIQVLPEVTFGHGYLCSSHSDWHPFRDFVLALDGPEAPRGAKKARKAAKPKGFVVEEQDSATQASMLDELPWLRKYVGAHDGATGASSSASVEWPTFSTGRDDAVADDGGAASAGISSARGMSFPVDGDAAIQDVFDTLERERAEWGVDRESQRGSAFRVQMAGGVWTKAHKGVEADCFRAIASGAQAERFCTQFGLNKSSRHAISTFGPRAACILASAWAHRMSYYFHLFQGGDAGGPVVVFTDKHHELYQEPEEFARMARGASGLLAKRIQEVRAVRPP